MKRCLPALLRCFCLLLVLGCTQCNSKRNTGGQKRMAVVVSTLNNPWFVFLAETAAAKAKSLGYETRIFDSQNNTSTEGDHFENILVSGFDAILFNSTDANGSVVNVMKAKNAGIPVFCIDREINSNTAAVYSMAGALAAIGGIMVTSRLDSAQPNAGTGYELDAIAAVVIGGTSLSGGRGSIWGTVMGAVIIGVLNNGLVLLNVSPFWQQVVKGGVILIAVIIDRIGNRNEK